MQIPSVVFYVMRHGETTDNLAGMISGGGSDPFLTLKGNKQAEIAALSFSYLHPVPEKIVSSSLLRARATAAYISRDIEIDADLNERHLGDNDGKISEEEQKIRKILGGEETASAHTNRVARALNQHLEDRKPALFICHGGTIRRIFEILNIVNAPSVANARLYRLSPHSDGWVCKEIL